MRGTGTAPSRSSDKSRLVSLATSVSDGLRKRSKPAGQRTDPPWLGSRGHFTYKLTVWQETPPMLHVIGCAPVPMPEGTTAFTWYRSA